MAIGGLLVFCGTLLYSFGSNKNSSSNMLKRKDISVDVSKLKKNDILIEEEDKKNI